MNKQKVIRAMCVLGATLASVPFVFESDLDLPVRIGRFGVTLLMLSIMLLILWWNE